MFTSARCSAEVYSNVVQLSFHSSFTYNICDRTLTHDTNSYQHLLLINMCIVRYVCASTSVTTRYYPYLSFVPHPCCGECISYVYVCIAGYLLTYHSYPHSTVCVLSVCYLYLFVCFISFV